jgi:hypothetical protein
VPDELDNIMLACPTSELPLVLMVLLLLLLLV